MFDGARWLDREALAAHISVRVDELPRLQRAGKLPRPSHHLGPRSPRWWSAEVDAMFGLKVASLPKGAHGLAAAILETAGR
jgi:predicted DNA-binding transcriptional regulator AlpA